MNIETVKEFIRDNNLSVELLSDEYINAKEKLKFRCDCGNAFEKNWNNFKSRKRVTCQDCGKKERVEKKRKTHHDFIKEVEELYPDKYDVISTYKAYHEHVEVRHNECGKVFKVTPSNLLRGRGCPRCNRPNYGRDTAIIKQQVYDLTNGDYELISEYKTYNKHMKLKHVSCGHEWNILPGNFFNHNRRCPKCAILKNTIGLSLTNQEFLSKFSESFFERYRILSEYKAHRVKVKVEHKECGYKWFTPPFSLLKLKSCPKCGMSQGEKIISKWLDKKGFDYEIQHPFDKCKRERLLPFDFYLPDINTCIEYDGELHFQYARYSKDQKENEAKLKYQQENDAIKSAFCNENDINLIRIPYTKLDEIEDLLSTHLL